MGRTIVETERRRKGVAPWTTSENEESKRRRHASGLFIPAGLFIGMGLGWALGFLVQGLLIGLGVGLLAMALVRLKSG